MQETLVQSLIWEDPTCLEAAKPMLYNYGAHGALEPKAATTEAYWVLKPVFHNERNHCSEKPVHYHKNATPDSPQLEKKPMQQQRPSTAKKKERRKIIKRWVVWLQVSLQCLGFLGGSVVKNLPANAGDAGDTGSVCGSGRSSGEGNGNPLQYSCLGNPKSRGAWWGAAFAWSSWGWTRLGD